MAEPLKIVVVGASGRMGQSLIGAVDEATDAEVVAATERAGHDWVGQDLGAAMGGAPRGVTVTDDAAAAIALGDALLDFTIPDATVAHAKAAAKSGAIHVIGTTGFDPAHIAAIDACATGATIIRAGNMSLGVNLLTALTKRVAAALDTDFDIEIVEMHHNRKIDAPSGTALMLGEAAAAGRGVSLEVAADRGRDGITGAREAGRIGFAALRGGDVVGEHEVIFAGAGERIVLKHIATDRMLFARGAVKAALWGRGRAPGAYDMFDVLGLS